MARIPGVRADSHAAWLWLLAIVLAAVATWLWGRRPAASPGGRHSEGVQSEGVRDEDFVELEAVEAQFGLEPVQAFPEGAPPEAA